MSSRLSVTFAASAVADLEGVRTWYREIGAPEAGERLILDVLSKVERLRDFPQSGRVVPEFAVERLREVVHPPFRIVYRMDERRIRVVRVWRSERLMSLPGESSDPAAP